jgi:hypothetical protein
VIGEFFLKKNVLFSRLREINSTNRGVFEQGNVGDCKPILKFLVMAYENTKVVGGRDWQVFSTKMYLFL